MMGDGVMAWGGGFMWIFWILLIVVIVMIVKGVSGGSSANNPPQDETPLDILKKRYARGEINEVEYERRKKELES